MIHTQNTHTTHMHVLYIRMVHTGLQEHQSACTKAGNHSIGGACEGHVLAPSPWDQSTHTPLCSSSRRDHPLHLKVIRYRSNDPSTHAHTS